MPLQHPDFGQFLQVKLFVGRPQMLLSQVHTFPSCSNMFLDRHKHLPQTHDLQRWTEWRKYNKTTATAILDTKRNILHIPSLNSCFLMLRSLANQTDAERKSPFLSFKTPNACTIMADWRCSSSNSCWHIRRASSR